MYIGDVRAASRDDVGQTVSAADIVRYLRKHYVCIAAVAALGMAAGLAVSYTRPLEWEATSIVEIGQVDDGGIRPVDPIVQAALRVSTESFRNEVLRTLGLPLDDGVNARTSLIRHSLQASGIPSTNLFAMTVRGFSPESAKATLQVALDQLIATHRQTVDEVRGRLEDQLKMTEADIARLQAAQQNRMRTLAHTTVGKDVANGAVQALLGNMVDATNDAQLQGAQQRRAALLTQLGPDHTYNTHVLGRTTVSRSPIAPKRSVFLGVGGALGLLAGLLLAGRRHAGANRSA